MKVMPIRFVADVEQCEHFYTVLGLNVDRRGRTPGWTEMTAHGGLVGLHSAEGDDPPWAKQGDLPRSAGTVELTLVTEEPLEEVARRLDAAGYDHEPIADEAFGRFMQVIDPDGLTLQVQEHDPTLYT
jgi:catechol 2,3-dioxygenase-like lactoylglutathione lyase family enzyme